MNFFISNRGPVAYEATFKRKENIPSCPVHFLFFMLLINFIMSIFIISGRSNESFVIFIMLPGTEFVRSLLVVHLLTLSRKEELQILKFFRGNMTILFMCHRKIFSLLLH
jgi:hypothetical protein